jgi:transposase InsO family protein
MIDRFSRYCLLQPVRDIKALTILHALEHWVSHFGAPQNILSDNGSQFIAEIFKEYNECNGTKLSHTTRYNPACNGMIERLHRWIKERLSLIAFDTGANFVDGSTDRSDFLPIIQSVYNNTQNRMTNFAPASIVFGRDFIRQPFINRDRYTPSFDNPLEYNRWMVYRRAIINNEAITRTTHYDLERKRHFDKTHQSKVTFAVGDYVLHNIHDRLVGNEQKLQPNFVGPYEITSILDDGQLIVLQDLNGSDTFKTNVKQIKPYNHQVQFVMLTPSMLQQYFTMDKSCICDLQCNFIQKEGEEDTPSDNDFD